MVNLKTYGLIGFPLGHSFSATYFNNKFGRENISARYDLYPLTDISQLPDLISSNPTLEGLNVTIPYKIDVIPFLTSLSEEASGIGAVNVIKISRHHEDIFLKGFNSDAYGFSESLRRVCDKEEIALPSGEEAIAIVLGSGGASKAVMWSLRRMGFNPILAGRTHKPGCLAYGDLTPEMIYNSSVIVNTTPVGMSPHISEAPPLPFEYLHQGQICFDLIYNPNETLFMKIARAHGCVVSNGLEMLHLQAEKAWEIWG